MANFFLEILMEEIPSRFQSMALQQLREKFENLLKEQNLTFCNIKTYVTPRRLVAYIENLPEKQEDKSEKRKGPRIDAPEKAIQGFLKSLNIRKSDCLIEKTPKGEFLTAEFLKKGKATSDILKDITKNILDSFFWPKTMRWGEKEARWVRPIRHINLIFKGKVLHIEWHGIRSSNKTQGHHILHPEFFEVKSWSEYKQELEKRFVLLKRERKIKKIQEGISLLSKKINAAPQESKDLIKEVAGLVEYPWFIKGSFDEKFLKLPKEILETTMRVHQRYFLLYKGKNPVPFFIIVSNMPTNVEQIKNNIRKGNEKVLKARLEDASFYWNLDQKKTLRDFSLKLKERLFYKNLGTMWEKKERLETLIKQSFLIEYLEKNQISKKDAIKAAKLCKADLCTGIVAEFPELQGIMGGYYAGLMDENKHVCDAIKEHYNPAGPEDFCPQKPLSAVLSLLDKIDTLVGFFSKGLIPTGSKDPYALRRSALGLLRLIFTNNLDFDLTTLLERSYNAYIAQGLADKKNKEHCMEKIQDFLKERLRYYLKEKGHDHKVIEASLFRFPQESLFKTLKNLTYIEKFLRKKEGEFLLKNYRRISNIIDAEKQILGKSTFNKNFLSKKEEKDLFFSLGELEKEFYLSEDIEKQIEKLLPLQTRISEFFDKLLINDLNQDIRNNRLFLVARSKNFFDEVFPFSLL